MIQNLLTTSLRIIYAALIVLFSCTNIYAEIELKVQLQDSVLILGDEISLQLKVDGAKDNVKLQFPEVDGLSFRQLGAPSSSSQTIITNGKISRFSGLVYNIGISAEKIGSYQIPGISVHYDKELFTSLPFKLRVRAPDQVSSMRVVTSVSKEQIYHHQPLFITLKWYIQDDIEDYAFRFPLLDRKDELGLDLRETAGSGNASNINVNSYRIPFSQGTEKLKGEKFTVYEVQFKVFPAEPGKFKIPAASVKASIRAGYELQRDFFGRTVRSPKLKRIFSTSKAISVNVKPLPKKDRPSSFTGAVGQFTVQLSAENRRVKVGDPLELAIRIRGKGRLEKINQPALSEIPEYQSNFVIVDSIQPGDVQESSILFKQTIRPRHDQVKRIPPVLFSFFDPIAEKYVTIQSNSLDLKVLPAKRLTAEDIVVFEKTQATEGNATLTKKETGIYAIYAFEDALQNETRPWGWYLLLIFPPLIYLSSLLLNSRYQRLHNDNALIRAKSANAVKNKQLKRAKQLISEDGNEIYQELSRCLNRFIADRLNLGTGELTINDVEKLSQENQVPEELAQRISAYIQDFDRRRFTHQEASTAEKQIAYNEVSGIIKELGKQL